MSHCFFGSGADDDFCFFGVEMSMNPFKNMIPCPRCKRIIDKTKTRCIYCGFYLVKQEVHDKGESIFSSSEHLSELSRKAQDTPGQEESFGMKRAVLMADDRFHSSSRTAANGGYTQQQTKRIEEPVYTGNRVERDPNDAEYYSSDRVNFMIPEKKRHMGNVSDDDYYHSKSDGERQAGLQTNAKANHNPEFNPYTDAEKFGAVKMTAKQEENSTEYVANNILEFTKHRFGKEEFDKIDYILSGLIGCCIFTYLLDVLFDLSKKTFPFALGYIILIIILSFIVIKKLNKYVSLSVAIVTMVYSLIMVLFMKTIDQYARAPELVLFYTPIMLANVMCLRLTTRMSRLYVKWETYLNRSKWKDMIDKSTDDYEIYGQESPSDQ